MSGTLLVYVSSLQLRMSLIMAGCRLNQTYNTLPRYPVFRILSHLGAPRHFLDAWAAHLSSFTRYFVVHRICSAPVHASTGYPEGCPLSCVAMAVVDLLRHCWQQVSCPRVLALSFVDNCEVLTDQLDSLRPSYVAFQRFCTLLDSQIDEEKLYFWSTFPEGRQQLKQQGFNSDRDLGGQVIYCQQLRNRVLTNRVEAVKPYFQKLRASRFPSATKRLNLVQVLSSRALHGCESVRLGSAHIRSFAFRCHEVPSLES